MREMERSRSSTPGTSRRRTEVVQAGFLMVVYSSFLETSTGTDLEMQTRHPGDKPGSTIYRRLDSGFRRNDDLGCRPAYDCHTSGMTFSKVLAAPRRVGGLNDVPEQSGGQPENAVRR